MKLSNFLSGSWVEGASDGVALINPVSGETLAYAGSSGLDLQAALAYAREVGGKHLRALTYAQRAELLNQAAALLLENREKYHQMALANSGNTKGDAGIDIEGGIGTLQYYAALGAKLGDVHYLTEPGKDRLTKDKNFMSSHILTPVRGVAIHINAFNFPSWGLWEKAAVSLLSGVPVFSKPATATSLLSHAMVKDVVDAGIFPEGALSIICGGGHNLMDFVERGDVVLFTGSADTAQMLKSNPQVMKTGIRFNVEADSVNLALLGPDVTAESAVFNAFVKEVAKEMTIKGGQKCTAIRRVLVPASLANALNKALCERLEKIVVGDPQADGVRMGPLVNKAQQQAAQDGIEILSKEAKVVFGGGKNFQPVGAKLESGCFVQPTLLYCPSPMTAERVHDTEVFGPVATVLPYNNESEAFELAAKGGGSLAGSVFTNDSDFAARASVELSSCHGRLLVVDEAIIAGHSGHGIAMPQCIHGGPGRAGGGEELGGLRGLRVYHQRTAIQGNISLLEKLDSAASSYLI